MRLSRPIGALLGALAAACVLGGVANAAATTCGRTYSYAGLAVNHRLHGVGAVIAPLTAPTVNAGHVAAWVGVGGPGYGPKGTDAWLQVGLAAYAGFPDTSLYYEIAQPGYYPKTFEMKANVSPFEKHRMAVLEVRGRPNVWRVWVDGHVVSPPYYLVGSHLGWEPQVTAESWNAGQKLCNAYSYDFSRVALASVPGGGWRHLRGGDEFQDPGYRMVRRSPASFVAIGRA